MKTLHYFITALMLLLTTYLSGQQAINPLEIEINIETDSITKAALLDTISKKTNVHFSYNPILLGAELKVKITPEKTTILSVLKNIIDPQLLGFHTLGDQIILYPMKTDSLKEEQPKQDRPITINGNISDLKSNEPIPFCNVAIVGKTVGTMSNQDGYYTIKIPVKYQNDTLRFSCLGFSPFDISIASETKSFLNIKLERKVYHLKTVDVVHYQPTSVLQNFFDHRSENYNDVYTLFTTFYREIVKENSIYTEVSEAVLNLLKAPYSNEYNEDLVKFVKGRKSSDIQPFNEIKFKLKGGPYYITKLDVIKNNESFIDPAFIHLYTYEFQKITLIDGRKAAVISFTPIYNLRDLLYEGTLYFDIETWALSRVEFNYTRQGLQEARSLMVEKEPKGCKVIPSELSYQVQYKQIRSKWYLYSARSSMQIKILNKEKKQRTNFKCISEILTTNIEFGTLQHFSRKDIFRPNEFFTEKINSYDKTFWENYNVIQPEEELNNALKNFDNHDLIISNKEF
jgi:hypothetical protein